MRLWIVFPALTIVFLITLAGPSQIKLVEDSTASSLMNEQRVNAVVVGKDGEVKLVPLEDGDNVDWKEFW